MIGSAGNELLVRLARHLTMGYRQVDERVINILKQSVVHFLFPPDSTTTFPSSSKYKIDSKSSFYFIYCVFCR